MAVVLRLVLAADVGLPVARHRAEVRDLGQRLGGVLGDRELALDGLLSGVGVLRRQAERVRVGPPEGRALLDLRVEQRLGDGRVVDLAVAVPAVADQVDDHVAQEAVAEARRDPRCADDGRRVLGVDVEDRDRLALGDVGGEARRVEGRRLGGEADQIVDDDVHRTADAITLDLREVEALGGDPLAGERRVAMHRDREDLARGSGADPGLAGTHATHGDRVDGLEMRRVGDQVDQNLALVRGPEEPGRAEVVLDVPSAHDAARIDVLEAGEQVHRIRADDVSHDVEPTAVTHREQCALGLRGGRRLEHLDQ